MFRNFDWFSGHSWSQGLFKSADGKDQESTSEEVNFHYGLYLWGIITKNQALSDLGNLMFAMARRSINKYFLMDKNNKVHPANFIGNKVTGIFFENKCDYATWFGGNIEFKHGIQMLPASPATELVRYSSFISEEWELLKNVAPNLKSPWASILYTSYASINKQEAFNKLRSLPLDDGLTRTWALYYASTRPKPKTVTAPKLPQGDFDYGEISAAGCKY